MQTVQYYFKTLDRETILKSFKFKKENFFKEIYQLKKEYIKTFDEFIKTELFAALDKYCQVTPNEVNPLDKSVIFAHKKYEDMQIQLSVIHEKELLKNKEKSPRYSLSGLSPEEIVSMSIADNPYTLNNIYIVIMIILFDMWFEDPETVEKYKEQYKKTAKPLTCNFGLYDKEVYDEPDRNVDQLKKNIWDAKKAYDKYLYDVELMKLFDALLRS